MTENEMVALGESLQRQADDIVVKTTDDVEVAKAYVSLADGRIKEIKEYFAPLKKVAKESHQQLVDREKDALKPYTNAKGKLKAALGAFQKKLDKAVEAQGEDALVASNVAATRKFWKFKIVDEEKVPREYMAPDEKKLGSLARTEKEKASVPGVEFYYDY